MNESMNDRMKSFLDDMLERLAFGRPILPCLYEAAKHNLKITIETPLEFGPSTKITVSYQNGRETLYTTAMIDTEMMLQTTIHPRE